MHAITPSNFVFMPSPVFQGLTTLHYRAYECAKKDSSTDLMSGESGHRLVPFSGPLRADWNSLLLAATPSLISPKRRVGSITSISLEARISERCVSYDASTWNLDTFLLPSAAVLPRPPDS
jgi:hypothetical protein